MPPNDDAESPRRKRRTRGHVIAGLSENHLERKVLLKGHVLQRPEQDYGVDAMMFHYGADGRLENGEVRFQLKATDRLQTVAENKFLSIAIETGDLDCWSKEIYPFILVVYDALHDRAYWLDIQEYVGRDPEAMARGKKKVRVRIPLANKLTAKSVDLFRYKSLQVIDELRDLRGDDHVKRKPR